MEISNSILGLMLYNDDDESWVGHFNSFEFHLAYNESTSPSDRLIEYAISVLSTPDWLQSELNKEKINIQSYYDDSLKSEIQSLDYVNIMFYERGDSLNILAQLSDDLGDRLWRIEFTNRKCDGIGFDT